MQTISLYKFVQCFLYAEYINVSLDIDTNLNNYKHEYIDAEYVNTSML